jgi:predicted ATPase/DNA-binding CsgD family transcriptional regulator
LAVWSVLSLAATQQPNIGQVADSRHRDRYQELQWSDDGWQTEASMTDQVPEATVQRQGRPAVQVPNNLPVQLTSFIGRDADLAAVDGALDRSRLVTLTGPGGAGKTRLAWQVAAERADQYPDGVWWVELAGIDGGSGVPPTVASALGVLIEPTRGPLGSLIVHLADRQALLALDNAEHVLDAVAGVADAVLHGCPAVTLLITSREPLSLPGELVWPVPPLADGDALRLFVERATSVRPGFTLDASSEESVHSIARHLDGIPLALELAAAWVRSLTPQQIEAALDDRFKLLVRGPRGAQRRLQTLAGSIDWSHALLDATDRTAFRRLGVFVGTFGLAAAEAVVTGPGLSRSDVLPAIARLVDKSLVVADEHAGEARYRLLETIRAYALARLVEAKEERALRERHLAWYRELAESTDADRVRTPDAWRRRLRVEYDNLRAALDWGLVATDPDEARRLAAALGWLWHLDRRGREGTEYLRRAIDRAPNDRSLLHARLLTGLALVVDTADPLDLEYDAATRALELATEVGDEGLRALCLNLAAVGAFYTDFDAAWELCDQAYRAADTAGNQFVLGGSRALQAIILHLRDRHAEAEAIVDETVRNHLRIHRGVLSTVLGFQARGALAIGDVARARDLAEEAVGLAEPLADYLRVGAARAELARIQAVMGDMEGALRTIDPILRLVGDAAGAVFVPGLGRALGVLSVRLDNSDEAIRWLDQDARSTDREVETWLAAQALPLLAAALTAVGRTDAAASALDRAVAIGERLGMPGVLAEAAGARAELAASESEGHSRAIDVAHDALAISVEHGLRAVQPAILEALARYGAALKPTIDDARLLFAADGSRVALGLPRDPLEGRRFDEVVATLRRALGDGAVEAAAVEGRRLRLDMAVALARRMRGTRGRPVIGWASLTRTELEVVELVAAGISNPEIGTRLFMSRSTVKTHLSHVFAKLGLSNRTELAAAATERGISAQR